MIETATITILGISLTVSLLANGIFVWYIKRLIQNIVLYTEGVDIVTDSVDQKLQELENFSRKDLILNDPDVMFVVNLIRDSKNELQEWSHELGLLSL